MDCVPIGVLSFRVRLTEDVSANAFVASAPCIDLRRGAVAKGVVWPMVAVDAEVLPLLWKQNGSATERSSGTLGVRQGHLLT